MKKLNKQDKINIAILILFILAIVLILTRGTFLYGSLTDFETQHFSIPEYFRTLFYDSKDLFPDFAPHLGSGQNIYNLAYYGLYSPIIIISYFLPFIEMIDYIMLSSIVILIVSVILIYKWLKNNNYSSMICFLVSFIFISASPLIFHSHRHIMFMNYFVFLIMGLFGVDKYFNKNKKFLLALSVFLMVMTSYYYSIGGIICLVLYGIYKYKQTNKLNFKSFITDGFKFCIPILIGVISSAILIIPTFLTLLQGRSDGNVTIGLTDLLMPDLSFKFLLYNSYSLGFTSIALFSIIWMFKKDKFLSIMLLLASVFPFVNYILNGTLYIDAKALIPLIPLVLIAVAYFLSSITEHKIRIKNLLMISTVIIILMFLYRTSYEVLFYIDIIILIAFIFLYNKYKKNYLIYIPIIITCTITVLVINLNDKLIPLSKLELHQTAVHEKLIKESLKDEKNMYRTNTLLAPSISTNKVYDINYYASSIYSSISNKGYNQFYFDTFNNPITYRNRSLTTNNDNLLFNMYIGNKYIISKYQPSKGYQLVKEDSLNVYKNDNVYPIMYATSNIISKSTFDKTKYPYNVDMLLNNVVVDKKTDFDYQSKIKKIDLDITQIITSGLTFKKEDNKYNINADETNNMQIKFKTPLTNKILFIRFDILNNPGCSNDDIAITINNMKNKLTCKSWKYHNGNYKFDYVISEDKIDSLNVVFTENNIKLGNIETYILDYSDLPNIKNNISPFIVDKNKTKGDIISGSIDVLEDGYFKITMPYDKGFKIEVDGKNQDYEVVDETFIGFKINKGKHNIKITYEVKSKKISSVISIIGVGSLIYLYISDRRGDKNGKNIRNCSNVQ